MTNRPAQLVQDGVRGVTLWYSGGYIRRIMIEETKRLQEFEASYQREAFAGLTYDIALARFAAMWDHARQLNPDLGADWEADLVSDLAIARAVNGLPPIP